MTFSLIGLVTADLPAARAFYRRLGLDVPEGDDHVEVTLPGGMRIAWDTEDVIRSFDPGWQRATGSRVSLAFDCGSPAEVDRLWASFDAGHVSPFDAPWGQRYATLFDPDGNGVDLFAALPG